MVRDFLPIFRVLVATQLSDYESPSMVFDVVFFRDASADNGQREWRVDYSIVGPRPWPLVLATPTSLRTQHTTRANEYMNDYFLYLYARVS